MKSEQDKELEARKARHKLQLKKDFDFPDEYRIGPEDEKEIIDILYGPKFKKEDHQALPRAERVRLGMIFTKGLNHLVLEDLEQFCKKLEDVFNSETRKELWEANHFEILKAIDDGIRKHNRFPSRKEIRKKTELSRQTIHKHLKEYFNSEEYQGRKDEYLVMRENVLARLYKFASEGDNKAAKIFLDATAFAAESPRIQNQNNYLQFNNLTITSDQLNALPQPEKDAFYDILRKVNPNAVLNLQPQQNNSIS